jgi:hypothetical protein
MRFPSGRVEQSPKRIPIPDGRGVQTYATEFGLDTPEAGRHHLELAYEGKRVAATVIVVRRLGETIS